MYLQRERGAILTRSDHDISILIQRERGQSGYCVSETRFHISASGPTRDEALAAFWRVFSGYDEVLSQYEQHEEEHSLSPEMLAQLIYVRAVMAYEHKYEKTAVLSLEEATLPITGTLMPSMIIPQRRIQHRKTKR